MFFACQNHIVVSHKVYLMSMPRKENLLSYHAASTMTNSREPGLKMASRYVVRTHSFLDVWFPLNYEKAF